MIGIIGRALVFAHWAHVAAINARRQHRNWRALGYGALAGVLAGLRLTGVVLIIAALWNTEAWWTGLAFGGLMALRTLAPVLVRRVTVPLGQIRATYVLTRIQKFGANDAEGYALVASAWAAQHASLLGSSGTARDWLAQRCEARGNLGDCEIATHGLLAASLGGASSRTRAWHMLTSIELSVEYHPAIRELVGEYLAVAAAEREDWLALVDFDAAAWPASPLRFLLEGVAARCRWQQHLDSAAPPAPRELWARWIMAPYRRATWPLLQRALAARTVVDASANNGVAPSVATVAASESAPPVRTTIEQAVAALSTISIVRTSAELANIANLCHAALVAPETTTWMSQRIAATSATTTAAILLDTIITTMADAIAVCAKTHALQAPSLPTGKLGTELARRLRHGTLDTLEDDFARWAEQCQHEATGSLIAQWHTFVALKQAYETATAIGGIGLQRLAFPKVFHASNAVAASWWNKRDEYVVSHAVSMWLLTEALRVGDAQAIELGRKNCALAVPTRTGVARP